MNEKKPISAGRLIPLLAFCAFCAAILLFAAGNAARAADATPSPYAAAYAEAARTGRPLIVEIGAAWCGPCKQVETLYGKDLRAAGVVVHLDCERDRDWFTTNRVPIPARIPALIAWERKRGAWAAPRLEIGLPRIGIYLGELRKKQR